MLVFCAIIPPENKYKEAVMQSKHKHIIKVFVTLLLVWCILSSSFIALLFVKQSTPQYVLNKIGFNFEQPTNWTLFSWNSSLEQLKYDSDIIFIGDSLTCGENFQEAFPKSKILNLGLSGDTILGVSERSKVISNFAPEKIFIECGVNSFSSTSFETMVNQYEEMISTLSSDNPLAQIYIQSVFPISQSRESGNLTNENIVAFNTELQSIADDYNAVYIDIYSHYVDDGQIKAEYTIDGIHLKDEYKYLWLDVLSEYI